MGQKVHYIKLHSHASSLTSSCLFHKQVLKPGLAQYHYSVSGVNWEVFIFQDPLTFLLGTRTVC